MPSLHDPAFRQSVRERLHGLTPADPPRWGRMTPDQMLWHVNAALDAALGHVPYEGTVGPKLPKPILRFMVLHGPWPKGRTPTLPQFVARERYDFDAERARCLALIDEFTARPLGSQWVKHPILGDVDGAFYSKLQGRHLEHHLSQFGR
jgi:hypothetical protein